MAPTDNLLRPSVCFSSPAILTTQSAQSAADSVKYRSPCKTPASAAGGVRTTVINTTILPRCVASAHWILNNHNSENTAEYSFHTAAFAKRRGYLVTHSIANHVRNLRRNRCVARVCCKSARNCPLATTHGVTDSCGVGHRDI